MERCTQLGKDTLDKSHPQERKEGGKVEGWWERRQWSYTDTDEDGKAQKNITVQECCGSPMAHDITRHLRTAAAATAQYN